MVLRFGTMSSRSHYFVLIHWSLIENERFSLKISVTAWGIWRCSLASPVLTCLQYKKLLQHEKKSIIVISTLLTSLTNHNLPHLKASDSASPLY